MVRNWRKPTCLSSKTFLWAKTQTCLHLNTLQKSPQNFGRRAPGTFSSLKHFQFLGKELIGDHHFVLDNGWTEARYFKMTTADRVQYYHFRCYQDGKVGLIFAED